MGLHQVGPRIRGRPAEQGALAVGEQDRRPDLFEQRHEGRVDELLRLLAVGQERDLAGEELVERGIALHARAARPLRVELGLREQVVDLRRRVGFLEAAGAEPVVGAVDLRVGARAPAPDLIDHVDLVALLDEALHPARAAIRGGEEVHPGLGEAVHHHHRVGLGDLGRRARLHEHLADHHGLVAELLVAAADIDVARPGDRLVGRVLGWRLGPDRRRRQDRALNHERPHQEAARDPLRNPFREPLCEPLRAPLAGHTSLPRCAPRTGPAYCGKRGIGPAPPVDAGTAPREPEPTRMPGPSRRRW